MKVTSTLITDGGAAARYESTDAVGAPPREAEAPSVREKIVLKKPVIESASASPIGATAGPVVDTKLSAWLRSLDVQADTAALALMQRVTEATGALRPAASKRIGAPVALVASPDTRIIILAPSVVPARSTLAPPPSTPVQIVQVPAFATKGGPALRWLYVACHLVMSMSAFHRVVINGAGSPFLFLDIIFAATLLRLPWLHFAWTRLHQSGGQAYSSDALSPAGAVLRFLIPGYNVYWAFAVHLQFCRAINEARANVGLPRQASRDKAFIAVLVSMIPLLDVVLGTPLWLDHMSICDRAIDEIARTRQGSSTPILPAP